MRCMVITFRYTIACTTCAMVLKPKRIANNMAGRVLGQYR